MRYVLLIGMLVLAVWGNLFANGVTIIDGEDGTCFELRESHVDVVIDNQIAIVTSTQRFYNHVGWTYAPKYGFPLPEGASATQLRWLYDDEWHEALIAPVVQDSTPPGPGEEWADNLVNYLGPTPLYYNMDEFPVYSGDDILIELTYVMLLPYEFGVVSFDYPNDYSLIQGTSLESATLHLELDSVRPIDNIQILSHTPSTSTNDGHHAVIEVNEAAMPADEDYHVEYTLSTDELGLFGFSTMLDSVPDPHGNGFFTFIAEPDPSESVVINKVFTLIVDRSGSMSGTKMVQARSAASYIVNHLNEGDRFNIVTFATTVTEFADGHVEYTDETAGDAIYYISNLGANGSTNISGAFSTAIPEFDAAADDTANIIIFFTDGEATTGITNTEQLVQHVHDLVAQTETSIYLFNFGIGSSTNEQLLTLLAQDNQGMAQFLEDNDLEEMITEFYMLIKNPVLIDPVITYSPTGIVEETFPDPVPNLYQGRQLITSGRYSQPTNIGITFSGTAYNQPMEYEYELNLVDFADPDRQFLPKIWAKQKIEYLMVQYYMYDEDSAEAEEIKEQIIEISMAYGVISPFTSFYGNDGIDDEEEYGEDAPSAAFKLLGNYPNPFNPSTTIRFQINGTIDQIVKIKIYNVRGQLVRVLALHVDSPGTFEIVWDGRDMNKKLCATGAYFYTVDFGNAILSSKMMMLK